MIKWLDYINNDRFPFLYDLNLKYLCIPSKSTASERVIFGEIVNKKGH